MTKSVTKSTGEWLQQAIDIGDAHCVFPGDKKFPKRPFDVAVDSLSANFHDRSEIKSDIAPIGDLAETFENIREQRGKKTNKELLTKLGGPETCWRLASLVSDAYSKKSADNGWERFGAIAACSMDGIESSLRGFYINADGHDERSRLRDFYNIMLDLANAWRPPGETNRFESNLRKAIIVGDIDRATASRLRRSEGVSILMPYDFRDPFEAAIEYILLIAEGSKGSERTPFRQGTWDDVLERINAWSERDDFCRFLLGERTLSECGRKAVIEDEAEESGSPSDKAGEKPSEPEKASRTLKRILGVVANCTSTSSAEVEQTQDSLNDIDGEVPGFEGDTPIGLKDFEELLDNASRELNRIMERNPEVAIDAATLSKACAPFLNMLKAYEKADKALDRCLDLIGKLSSLSAREVQKSHDSKTIEKGSSELEQQYRTYLESVAPFNARAIRSSEKQIARLDQRADSSRIKLEKAKQDLQNLLWKTIGQKSDHLERALASRAKNRLAQQGPLSALTLYKLGYSGESLPVAIGDITSCYKGNDPAEKLIYVMTCIFCVGSGSVDWNKYSRTRFDSVVDRSTADSVRARSESSNVKFYRTAPTKNVSVRGQSATGEYVAPLDLGFRSETGGFAFDSKKEPQCNAVLIARWDSQSGGDAHLRKTQVNSSFPLELSRTWPDSLHVNGELRISTPAEGATFARSLEDGSLQIPVRGSGSLSIVPSSTMSLLATLRHQASFQKSKSLATSYAEIRFPHIAVNLPGGPRLAQSGGLCMASVEDGVCKVWQISRRAATIIERIGDERGVDYIEAPTCEAVERVTLVLVPFDAEEGVAIMDGKKTSRIFAVNLDLAQFLFDFDDERLLLDSTEVREEVIRRPSAFTMQQSGAGKWDRWARFREVASFVQWK